MKTMKLLFDLGGILVPLKGMSDFEKWTGKKRSEILSIWLESESARELERGRLSFDLFHGRFVEEFRVDLSVTELREAFRSWVRCVNPGALDLLAQLHRRHSISCLTNTNSVQWPIVKETLQVDVFFDHQFVSHELGMVKPDPNIFQYCIATLDVNPDHILFVDDSFENVAAAKELGINSHQADSVESLRNVLIENGIHTRL